MKSSVCVIVLLYLNVLAIKAQDEDKTIFSNLNLYPVLWQQNAAEYRALCYQAFNNAKQLIDAIPAKEFRKQRLAVITDLDETIFNNSSFYADNIKLYKRRQIFSWLDWTNQSAATAVPGAVEFLQYAHSKGVTIFYISNRLISDATATLINIQKLQLPDADSSHLLLRERYASKKPRRRSVMKYYKVVMLFGDNLNDFADVFEKKPTAERFAQTDKFKDAWGKKFIVLPNPMYGEWQNALLDYQQSLKVKQKKAILTALLQGFN